MKSHADSGRLPYLGVLRFAGAEAAVFLQGQVSNDTRRLEQPQGLLCAYSSPQGRVVAVLHLLPHSSGILALLPREILLPTLERLRKFVMRAKVQIQDVSDTFAVAGAFDVGRSGESTGYVESAGLGVSRVSADDARHWMVGPHEALEEFGVPAHDAEFERRWRLADVRAGLPQIYAATRELFVAQMLNMDLIDGISFTKGCFTGQEIIARTQHLGRIKRRLHRLKLPSGSWAVGQAVRLSDGRSGRLTELVTADEGVEALAVLSEIKGEASGEAPETTAEDGTPVVHATELPLPYPLAQVR